MTRMKLLPGLPLDQIGHPPGSPQSGAITQGFRTLLQTPPQLLQLRRLQSRLAASAARFLERPGSVGFPGLLPPADRLPMHVELPGHLGLAQALVEEFSRFKSPLFQLVKIAFNAFGVTHAQKRSTGISRCHYIIRTSVEVTQVVASAVMDYCNRLVAVRPAEATNRNRFVT